MDKLPLESDKYLVVVGLCMSANLCKSTHHFLEHHKPFHTEFCMVFFCIRYLAIDTLRNRAEKQNKKIVFFLVCRFQTYVIIIIKISQHLKGTSDHFMGAIVFF
jgi:hypothetical protein